MSHSRRHLNGISESGNSHLITRVRSSSLSVLDRQENVDNDSPQPIRPDRRSEWTWVKYHNFFTFN